MITQERANEILKEMQSKDNYLTIDATEKKFKPDECWYTYLKNNYHLILSFDENTIDPEAQCYIIWQYENSQPAGVSIEQILREILAFCSDYVKIWVDGNRIFIINICDYGS